MSGARQRARAKARTVLKSAASGAFASKADAAASPETVYSQVVHDAARELELLKAARAVLDGADPEILRERVEAYE